MKKSITILLLLALVQFGFTQEDKISYVYFIRHAEKVKDGSDDPALTKIGAHRATYWAEVFKNIDFDAVYSTQTLRTINTALPSSMQSDVTITIYDAKEVDIEKLVNKHSGKNILIVGHSNSTPRLVNTLIEEEKYEEIKHNNNSNLYIVSVVGNERKVSLLYIDSRK